MKRCLWLLVVVLAGALVVTGCAGKNKINTSKLEKSFQSADPKNKEYSEQVVTASKNGDYISALAALQKLAGKARLTSEQQLAIRDTIAQVQKAMADIASKASGDAQKAANDIKKSRPLK
ncbi:MAG: hypothetical protein ABSC38_08555 [Verrucomicrobiia bacterium]